MGFPLKPPKPNPRRWTWAVVFVGSLLVLVAVNVSVWAAAFYFHRVPGVAVPPMKTAPPLYDPGATLTEVLVTDLRGDQPREYRVADYPPFDSQQRYRTLRRKTVPPPGALFHVSFSYADGKTNEIALLREAERLMILCGDAQSLHGDERSVTNEGVLDFLDSAWAMDIIADLRSYDPDEFARGLKRREERGDELTKELLDQLNKPEIFGGRVVPRLRLLLRPTQGVPLQFGPSLFGYNPEGDRRAELLRDGMLDHLEAIYTLPPRQRSSLSHSEEKPICDVLYWLMNAEPDNRLAYSPQLATQVGSYST
jgi:hypothetical protein